MRRRCFVAAAAGAVPATRLGALPIPLAAEFGLALDLKVALAIGIEVPPSILLRADEVIE